MQGVAFSFSGLSTQRKGRLLFYYSWAPHTLSLRLCTTQAQLNKLNWSTAGTWSMLVILSGAEAWVPHLLLLVLSQLCLESMSVQAGVRCLGWGTHGGKSVVWNSCWRCHARTSAGAAAVRSLREPRMCPHPDLLWALMYQGLSGLNQGTSQGDSNKLTVVRVCFFSLFSWF